MATINLIGVHGVFIRFPKDASLGTISKWEDELKQHAPQGSLCYCVSSIQSLRVNCTEPTDRIPGEVVVALARYNEQHGSNIMMEELKWDALNKCYYFMRAGMYHGVELNGHIHT
jgi:hypothetical protein